MSMYNPINPEVSIVTVSWNVKELILECIQSVYEKTQNYSFEIIIVDNDSKDGTPEAIEKKYPEVKLLKNKNNSGITVANNQGIKASKGQYICLLNPDTHLINNAIDLLVKYLEENTSVSAVGPQSINFGNVIEESCRKGSMSIWTEFLDMTTLTARFPKNRIISRHRLGYWDHMSIRSVDHIATECFIVRKNLLNQIGVMDEQFFMYGDDTDFCRRIKNSGGEIIYFPHAKIFHHKGSSSKQNSEIPIVVKESYYKYFSKHHGVFYALCYRFTVGIIGLLLLIYWNTIFFIANKEKKVVIRKQIIPSLKRVIHWVF